MLVRENLEMARESLRVQQLFDGAGLPVLFVKGVALAVLAFGNLLVARETVPAGRP